MSTKSSHGLLKSYGFLVVLGESDNDAQTSSCLISGLLEHSRTCSGLIIGIFRLRLASGGSKYVNVGAIGCLTSGTSHLTSAAFFRALSLTGAGGCTLTRLLRAVSSSLSASVSSPSILSFSLPTIRGWYGDGDDMSMEPSNSSNKREATSGCVGSISGMISLRASTVRSESLLV